MMSLNTVDLITSHHNISILFSLFASCDCSCINVEKKNAAKNLVEAIDISFSNQN